MAQPWGEDDEVLDVGGAQAVATPEEPWGQEDENLDAPLKAPEIIQPQAKAEGVRDWGLEDENVDFTPTSLPKPFDPPEPVQEGSGFIRQAMDVPTNIALGITTGLKSLTDLLGPENALSQSLSGNEQFYRDLLSAEAKQDQEAIAAILQEAEGKGVLDQVLAGVNAFAVAPVDMLSNALGTMAPVIATGLAGRIAKFGATGIKAIQAATGAGMGVGIAKNQIYEGVKSEMLAQGKTEEEAKAIATEAQAYNGKNLDQLLLAGGLGAVDAFTGAEKIIGNALAKAGGRLSAGVIANALKTGITEAVPEAAQAGQERLATNLALQREGVDVSLTEGVFSQAAMEGLAGFSVGGLTGAIEPRVETEPTEEQRVAAAAETEKAARESKAVAPATATIVEQQAKQTIGTSSSVVAPEFQERLDELKRREQDAKRQAALAVAPQALQRTEQRQGTEQPQVDIPTGTRLEAAAYKAPDGSVYYGASHLEAMAKARDAGKIDQAEIDAKQETTSRETPEFGYSTDKEGFIGRSQAEVVATGSGQMLVDKPATGLLHSNEVVLDAFAEAAPTTPVTPTATLPIEAIGRVVRGEQTPEDIDLLSKAETPFVEVYKNQPILTQAGFDALPEDQRPRLTPEVRKIQIDTGASDAAAEAISKGLRIGVDQVPINVKMPEGWTLEGDVYIPPVKVEVENTKTQYGVNDAGAKAILENQPIAGNGLIKTWESLPSGWIEETYNDVAYAIPPNVVKTRVAAQGELRQLSILERAALAGRLTKERLISEEDANQYINEASRQGFTQDEIAGAAQEATAKWDERFGSEGNARQVAGDVSAPAVDFAAEEAERAKQPLSDTRLKASELFGLTAREALQYLASRNYGAAKREAAGRPLAIEQLMQRAASILAKLPLRILDADFVKQDRGGARAYRSYDGFIRTPATIKGKPATVSPKTLVHEVGHTLTADAIYKYIVGTGGKNGAGYLRALDKAIADQAIPEPVRKLASLYKQTIKDLGLEKEYFGQGGLASTDATDSQKRALERKARKIVNPKTGKVIGEAELYGLANLDEFVAQAWSSTEFQDLLKSIKVQNKPSVYEQFVAIIRDLFGFPSDSMAAAVIDASLQIAQQEAPLISGKKVETRVAENVARGRAVPTTPTPAAVTPTPAPVADIQPIPPLESEPEAEMGVNINSAEIPFTDLILSGDKTIETRPTNSLNAYVGRRVGIVKTGAGKAMVVGYATIGQPVIYRNQQEFRAAEAQHRVPAGSTFDIKEGEIKYGYPLTDVVAVEPFEPVGRGNVIRRIREQQTTSQKIKYDRNYINPAQLEAQKESLFGKVNPETQVVDKDGRIIPRFMWHSAPSGLRQDRGFAAYKSREAGAQRAIDDGFGEKDTKTVWLGRYDREKGLREGAVMVDLAKLDPANLLQTGQAEGNVWHRGDIPESAINREQPTPRAPMAPKAEPEESKTVEMSLEMEKERTFQLLGERLYTAELPKVVVKETVQNSFDAIKDAEETGEIPRGSGVIGYSRKELEVNGQKIVRMMFSDNGGGMTPEILQNAFFTVGGTFKRSGKGSGGFGLAKLGMFMSADRVMVETVRNGVVTIADLTKQELVDKKFNVNIAEDPNRKNGTMVILEFKKSITRSDGKTVEFENPYTNFDSLIHHDLTVIDDNYGSYQEELIGLFQNKQQGMWSLDEIKKSNGKKPYTFEDFVKDVPNVETFEQDFVVAGAKKPIKVRVAAARLGLKRKDGKAKWNEDIEIAGANRKLKNYNMSVYSNGLFQFEQANLKIDPMKLWGGDPLPYSIVVDIDAGGLDAASLAYPFTNSREDFQNGVVKDYIGSLLNEIRVNERRRQFDQEFNLLTDISGGKPRKDSPTLYNNTTIVPQPFEQKFLEDLSRVIFDVADDLVVALRKGNEDNILEDTWYKVKSQKGSVAPTGKSEEDSLDYFYGVGISKNWGGVNTSRDPVSVLVNPIYEERVDEYAKTEFGRRMLARTIAKTLIHEINHHLHRNEGSDFTFFILQNEAYLGEVGAIQSAVDKILPIVNQHSDAIISLKNKFRTAETKDTDNELTGEQYERSSKKPDGQPRTTIVGGNRLVQQPSTEVSARPTSEEDGEQTGAYLPSSLTARDRQDAGIGDGIPFGEVVAQEAVSGDISLPKGEQVPSPLYAPEEGISIGSPEEKTIATLTDEFAAADKASSAIKTDKPTMSMRSIVEGWIESPEATAQTLKDSILESTNLNENQATAFAEAVAEQLTIQKALVELETEIANQRAKAPQAPRAAAVPPEEAEPQFRNYRFPEIIKDDLDPEELKRLKLSYKVLRNDVSLKEASKALRGLSIEAAIAEIRDMNNGIKPAVRSMMADITYQKIREFRKQAKQAGRNKEYSDVTDLHVDFYNWISEYRKELGQGVQAFARFQDLGPDGALRHYAKYVDKAMKKFIPKNKKRLQDISNEMNSATEEEFNKTLANKKQSIREKVVIAARNEAKKVTISEETQKVVQGIVRSAKPTLWENYQQLISDRLLRTLMADPNKTPPPSLVVFSNRLVQNLLGFVPEQQRKAQPSSVQSYIEDALNNKEKYEQAFNKTLEDVSNKVKKLKEKGEKASAELARALAAQDFLEKLAPQIKDFPVSAKVIDRFITQKAKDLQISLVQKFGEWYKSSVKQRRKLEEEFAELFLQELNIPEADAKRLSDGIVADFKVRAEARRKKILERFKAPKDERKGEEVSPLDKFFEFVNMGFINDQAAYEILAERYGLPKYNEKFAKYIYDMAQKIQDMDEGLIKRETTHQLMAEIAKEKGFAASEIGTGFIYANMLSSPDTHMVNIVDTVINNFANAFADVLATGDTSRLVGLIKGFRKGWNEAKNIMATGLRISMPGFEERAPTVLELNQFGRKGGVNLATFQEINDLTKSLLENPAAKTLNAAKYVGRFLEAQDAVSFAMSVEGQRYADAAAMAKEEGVKGKRAIRKRISEILNDSDAQYQKALQQAKNEGFTGYRQIYRALEINEGRIPQEIKDRSFERGLRDVYRNVPTGVAGALADSFFGFINNKIESPLARSAVKLTVSPFVVTPVNLFNKWLDWSPWGYKRLFFGSGGWLGEKYQVQPFERGTPEWRAQLFKASSSVLAMSTVYALVRAGIIALEGKGPSDEEERKQWLSDGNKPYTIKFKNGPAFSFAYLPWAIPLAWLANVENYEKYNKGKDTGKMEAALVSMAFATNIIMELPFMAGVADIVDLINPRATTSAIKRFEKFTEGKIGMLFPNALRYIDRLFDPTLYDTQGLGGLFIDQTPFVRTRGGKRLNLFGEPIGEGKPLVERLASRFVALPKPSVESQLLAKFDVYPYIEGAGKAFTVVDGERVIMDQDEYEKYATGVGQEFKQFLLDNYDLQTEYTEEEKLEIAKEIRRQVEEIRKNWRIEVGSEE